MSQATKSLGALGEELAGRFLESHGYRLVDSNVRPLPGLARGELDFIAWDSDTLVFIEVKSRRRAQGQQGSPAEAVDARKRAQIVQLANFYIAKHELGDIPCRFDVIEIVFRPNIPPAITHLKSAFDASDIV